MPSPHQPAEWTVDLPRWLVVDHVQLALPAGGEDAARAFNQDVLGLAAASTPPIMAARGAGGFEVDAVTMCRGDPLGDRTGRAR
ncbi:MAG: hypothetical protein ABW122_12700 [Ilumatobacteraceae bacterium]